MNIPHFMYKSQMLLLKCLVSALLVGSAIFAHAATLSVTPATGVYTAGQTFTARVVVNTNGASINAADGTLTFNPKEISVVSVSKGSIFSLWTAEPTFSNGAGTLSFSGGSPTGYTGSSGAILNVTFRANAAGSPRVSFKSGSVLAADGRGTNVLTTMNGGAFTITANDVVPEPETIEYIAPANTPSAPSITSSTHPDSAKWYTEKNAQLSWSLPSGVTSIRTLLDTNSGSIPTKVYETPMSSITLPDLSEGVQYFHIQFRNEDGWGKVAHYRLAVDTQKPSAFDIVLPEGADLANPVQTLHLKTTDETSKVKRFLVQLDGADPYEFVDEQGSSTLALPSLSPGHHTVIIEAFDEAQNSLISTFSYSILAFDKPQFTEYPKEINEQVIPVIKGITRPNAKVLVTLSQIGLGVSSAESSKTSEVQSDASGQFIYIPDGKLSLGVYELTAIASDEFGAQSEPSDPVRIAVQQPGFIQIGSILVSFLSVLIPLLTLLGALVLGTWFMIMRFRLLKKGVTREAQEASQILKTEFSHLRSEIQTQKEALESTRKTKKLTKAESDLFGALTLALKTSEARVEKEIGDVEDLVD